MLKIRSPNAYVQLINFVELQGRIASERQNTSALKHWRSKKQWEAELSFSYYELWIHYEQDTKMLARAVALRKFSAKLFKGGDYEPNIGTFQATRKSITQGRNVGKGKKT